MGKDQNDCSLELDLHLFRVFSRSYLTIAECDRRNIRHYGFNQTEFAVLELLYNKGPHPLQEIGDKILISSGSITYVVDKLEAKGLVSREASLDDRRVTYAAISEKGIKCMNNIFPEHARKIAKLLGGLNEVEKQQAIFLLKKLGMYASQV